MGKKKSARSARNDDAGGGCVEGKSTQSDLSAGAGGGSQLELARVRLALFILALPAALRLDLRGHRPFQAQGKQEWLCYLGDLLFQFG
jgi:hypothetical protein